MTMPALYYDTNAAAPLHALPRRIDIGERDRRVDPDNLSAVGILRLVPATPPEGFRIVASHGELVDGQWREVIDRSATPEEIEAERAAAADAAEAAALAERLAYAATDAGWAEWELGIVPVAARLIQLWQASGVQGLPASWPDAILALSERYDALSDAGAKADLLRVTLEAKQWREMLDEVDGQWPDVRIVAGILGAQIGEGDVPAGFWARVRAWFGL
jgi:hypothetical protein